MLGGLKVRLLGAGGIIFWAGVLLWPWGVSLEDSGLHVEQLGQTQDQRAVDEPNEQLAAHKAKKQHDVHQKSYFHLYLLDC